MNKDYEPWFESLWKPPSGEIESLLFASQAALGAGVIGYYIGKKKNAKNNNASIKTSKLSNIHPLEKAILSIIPIVILGFTQNYIIVFVIFYSSYL